MSMTRIRAESLEKSHQGAPAGVMMALELRAAAQLYLLMQNLKTKAVCSDQPDYGTVSAPNISRLTKLALLFRVGLPRLFD